MQNKIAVVVPVFNAEAWVIQTLLSVCRQTIFSELHLYIGIDGATDRSAEKIEQWITKKNLKNVTVFHSEHNLGKHQMLNKLVKDYVQESLFFLLDSDDLLMPSCIEELKNYLRQNEKLNGIRSGMVFFNQQNVGYFEQYATDPYVLRANLNFIGMGMFAHTGSLWRKEVFLETIEYFKNLQNDWKNKISRLACEDFFRAQLVPYDQRIFQGLNKPLMLYRLHDKQWSANSNPFEGSDIYDAYFRKSIDLKEFDLPKLSEVRDVPTKKYMLNNRLKNIVHFLRQKKYLRVLKEYFLIWSNFLGGLFLYRLISVHLLAFYFLHPSETPERIFVRLEWWYPKTLKPIKFLKDKKIFEDFILSIDQEYQLLFK